MTDEATDISLPDALPIGTVIGGYTIQRQLGQGGFSIVYLAYNSVTARTVAIKEFFPVGLVRRSVSSSFVIHNHSGDIYAWAIRQFEDAVNILNKLRHENIVTLYDYLAFGDTAYAILEFIDGVSLRSWLEGRFIAPTLSDLELVISPIMSAVAFVHRSDFVIRDISPVNIMITTVGRPVLCLSFGVVAADAGPAPGLWRHHYSAPEQAQAKATPEISSDIYSLAAVLYYALVGQPPVDGNDRMDALLRDRPDPYEPLVAKGLKGLPSSAAEAIDAALSMRREKRPASVIEFMLALGFTPESPMEPLVQPPAQPAKRSGFGRLIEHFRKRATRP